MKAPSPHPQEEARQSALDALGHVNSPAEKRFDAITEAVSETMGVPIALVSLIDRDKQWFKSSKGLDAPETDRSISFCGHAILGDGIFEVENALEDPTFSDNPLVLGEPYIRFYAGHPVFSKDGYPLGTLCIIGHDPRKLTAMERKRFVALAAWLEAEIQESGQASQELAKLSVQDPGRHSSWMDPKTKCWSRSAGTLLLDHVFSESEKLNALSTLGVVQLVPDSQDWTLLQEQNWADSIRARMAVRVRIQCAGATFFTDSPDMIFFFSAEPGALNAMPDLNAISKLVGIFATSCGLDESFSARGIYDHFPNGDAASIVARFCDEVKRVDKNTLQKSSPA